MYWVRRDQANYKTQIAVFHELEGVIRPAIFRRYVGSRGLGKGMPPLFREKVIHSGLEGAEEDDYTLFAVCAVSTGLLIASSLIGGLLRLLTSSTPAMMIIPPQNVRSESVSRNQIQAIKLESSGAKFKKLVARDADMCDSV